MWKTEHFLFRWTLWVLTQIYSKTRVYWNCLSQRIWKFLQRQPIPKHYLPEILRLILKENFFHFNGKHYLQNHGTVMGTKTAVLIPLPIFLWHILKRQLSAKLSLEQQFGNATYTMSFPYGTWVNQTSKPSLNKQTYITQLLNSWPKHLTLRCSVLRHGCIQRHKIQEKSILDAKTHFKWTETFLHTHFTSCHPPSVKKGFVKGEALRILRKNSSETTFEENNSKNAWWTEATHKLW